MRALSLARVLFTLLAFQLALGLQVGVAQAAAEAAAPPAGAARPAAVAAAPVMYGDSGGRDACPMHDLHNSKASDGTRDKPAPPPARPAALHGELHGDPTALHDKPAAPHGESAAPHDCCKSSGCQCHCGNLPLAFNLSAVRGAPATALAQPSPALRRASAPSDTHFRPPIAS